ncbi:SDR family oxidoreductase [Verrucomicrobiales bacterium]|jgi:NAD(P)-dependent dehydrogenase (short-subunit alcohol dehydrogenase family)|nr:SDR family oxidoreductase [Verrucomicrobiales bacterium]
MDWKSNSHNLLNLQGRTVFLTGAAGHIGRAMTDAFHAVGAKVLEVDREGSFDEAKEADPEMGSRFVCDLENEAERKELLKKITDSYESIDVMINNAAFVGLSGLKGWVTDFEEQSVETWRRAIEVNLTAAFELIQGLTPLLRETGRGSVVNIGSIYGFLAPNMKLYEGTPLGNPVAYAASKGGLTQMSRWMAGVLAPEIRVNVVSPGGIYRGQPDKFVERYEAANPMGRMGTEQDMIGAVVFLASDMSLYVTGQNLAVDGGWSVW